MHRLVAKRRDSLYEAGRRSGAWQKMRINQGQELVIGGYTPGPHGFDALVLGYYEGGKFLCASRTRNGFTPATRRQLFKSMKPLQIPDCPFANLPERKAGRWGQGLTAAKMKDCRWLRPELVGQFGFVEWTPDFHLRHTRFVALGKTSMRGKCGASSKANDRRICYAPSVRCCVVQMRGNDRNTHTLTLEASSVFDAADKAIQRWAKLWWFDPAATLVVQSCEDRWIVTQERVRAWLRLARIVISSRPCANCC